MTRHADGNAGSRAADLATARAALVVPVAAIPISPYAVQRPFGITRAA
jgi:hypothetical protein